MRPVTFIPVRDRARARAFYEGVLGLTLLEDTPFALVFDNCGIRLRVTPVPQLNPHPFTVLGWEVDDVGAEVDRLRAAGVQFARFPGMDQDERGVWNAPGGAQVAWFRDPDGNLLSFSG